MPSAAPDRDLTAALAQLWERRRDGFAARVQRVEAAVAALLRGTLEEPLRAEAEAEAHKLAGALGTFGVPRGSELARELEQSFAADRIAGESAARLNEVVLALGCEVERGPARRPVPPSPAALAPAPEAAAAAVEQPEDHVAPILVVTGDLSLARQLMDEGAARGAPVTVARDTDEASEMADRDQPAAAVVDLGQGSPDPVCWDCSSACPKGGRSYRRSFCTPTTTSRVGSSLPASASPASCRDPWRRPLWWDPSSGPFRAGRQPARG